MASLTAHLQHGADTGQEVGAHVPHQDLWLCCLLDSSGSRLVLQLCEAYVPATLLVKATLLVFSRVPHFAANCAALL